MITLGKEAQRFSQAFAADVFQSKGKFAFTVAEDSYQRYKTSLSRRLKAC